METSSRCRSPPSRIRSVRSLRLVVRFSFLGWFLLSGFSQVLSSSSSKIDTPRLGFHAGGGLVGGFAHGLVVFCPWSRRRVTLRPPGLALLNNAERAALEHFVVAAHAVAREVEGDEQEARALSFRHDALALRKGAG
jgi:hypothetical protein